MEIKRSPLPECIDEETEAPETKLSPLFSRGNDSGESALPQTQARQPGLPWLPLIHRVAGIPALPISFWMSSQSGLPSY